MLFINYILFLTFGITDAIDIVLVAIMLYLLYSMVKGTSAVNIFIGLALILAVAPMKTITYVSAIAIVLDLIVLIF